MLTDEEYAVFTAACRTDLYNWEHPDTTFCDQTVSNKFTCAPIDHLYKLFRYRCLKYPEMLQDFAEKNEQHWKIEKQFRVINGFQFLSERRILEPRREGDVFELSRVGFSREGEFGLVYLAYYGGPLCGAGHYLLFERNEKDWQLSDQSLIWKS